MRQILFHVPIIGLPVYGYGAMLFLAFIFCQWLAKRLCKRQGVNADLIPDLTIWVFVAGIIGGRLVYVIETWQTTEKLPGFDRRPWDVIKLWDGGLVLYGALFGGAIGYFAFDHFVMKKHGVSKWKMIDICAPCIALGIALGRIGCLFTGCAGPVGRVGDAEVFFEGLRVCAIDGSVLHAKPAPENLAAWQPAIAICFPSAPGARWISPRSARRACFPSRYSARPRSSSSGTARERGTCSGSAAIPTMIPTVPTSPTCTA